MEKCSFTFANSLLVVGTALCLLAHGALGFSFAESDVRLTEDDGGPRSVTISRERTAERVVVKVSLMTVGEFEEHVASRNDCNTTIDATLRDLEPAEPYDFDSTELIVTFENGENMKNFDLRAIDDNIAERTEVFILVSNFTEGISGEECAVTGEIIDNDVVTLEFNDDRVTIREGQGNFTDRLSVIKRGNSEPCLLIELVTLPVTVVTEGVDYQVQKFITFPGGANDTFSNEYQEQFVELYIRNDDLPMNTRRFDISLPSITEAGFTVTITDPQTAHISVIEDDPILIGFLALANIRDRTLFVCENDSIQLCATLQDPFTESTQFLDVSFTLTNMNATDNDYNIVFESGFNVAMFDEFTNKSCVTIMAIDDGLADGNRTFFIRLAISGVLESPINLFPENATIVIVDIDPGVTFDLAGPNGDNVNIQEGQNYTNLITLVRTGPTLETFIVTLEIQHIDTDDTDFNVQTEFTFGSEDAMLPVPIKAFGDGVIENAEQFQVHIASVSRVVAFNSGPGENSQLIVTIFDNQFGVGVNNEEIAEVMVAKPFTISILSPDDISPDLFIAVQLLVQDADNVTVEPSMFSLTSENSNQRIDITVESSDYSPCQNGNRSFNLILQETNPDPTRTVQLQKIIVYAEIRTGNCVYEICTELCVLCVAVPVGVAGLLLLLLLILVILLILFCFPWDNWKHYRSEETEKELEKLRAEEGMEGTTV